MLNRKHSCFLLFTLALPVFAADRAPVVERGLPQANLNDTAGDYRSNVRWGWRDHGFLGDDFTIGAPGEKWVLDGIRTWAVPGSSDADPAHLGDLYRDVRLYLGGLKSGLTPVATALLADGSDEPSNSNVQISDATRSRPYINFGTPLRVWQVDFSNLNLVLDGGVRYGFGVFGMGRQIPGSDGETYEWFNHASNASLSAARQDGSDGVMLLFDAGGKLRRTLDAKGAGWDKSADINVEVFAHRVHSGSPATLRATD